MGAPELEIPPSSDTSNLGQPSNQHEGPAIHIKGIISNALNMQTERLSGWQAGVLIQERIGLIFNM
jgi:hypothetical protein